MKKHTRLKFLLSEPLRYGATESGYTAEEAPGGVRYIRITDIDANGTLRDDNILYLPKAKAAPYLLEQGDILLARSGATVGKAFLFEKSEPACFAGYLIRARANKVAADPRFIHYFFQSTSYWDYVNAYCSQATIQNLNASLYGNIPVPSLPLNRQKTVADFLGSETAKTDALIAKYKRLMGILEEKRLALVRKVVTKGINGDAPLKKSEIPWFGEIPAHWDLIPLKYLVNIASGSTPSKDNPAYWGGDIPWASAKDLKVDTLVETEDHITEVAVRHEGVSIVPAGVILTVVRGMILAHTFPVAITAVPMAFNQDLKAIYVQDRLRVQYLAWVLRSIADEILSRADTAGHGTKVLRSEDWQRFLIPVPPLTEQDEIVRFVDAQGHAIKQLQASCEEALLLTKERRSALITAAVTGQIDVNTYKSQTDDEVA